MLKGEKMQVVYAKDLSVGYEGKSVCENINFNVEEGDYLCIIGDNGAGKSTLVKTLLGLLPKVKGTLKISEKQIGYLPQQQDYIKGFPATVYEIVLSGFLNKLGGKIFYPKSIKIKAIENLKLLGIENLKNRSFNQLSGGQQQKVLLARALSATSKLLVVDEPVTGLDPQSTIDMYETIKMLNKKLGIAVIMISHDLDRALSEPKNILYVKSNGCFFGSVEEYKKQREAR